MKCYCINLKKRRDRKSQCIIEFNKHGLDVQFFNAIDGKTLGIRHKNDRFTEGMTGCWLSHLILLQQLDKNELNLIMEDDVHIVKGFKQRLEAVLDTMPKCWDVCLLGWNPLPGSIVNSLNDKLCTISRWCGAHGYLVNKGSSVKIVNLLEKHGIVQEIDNQLANYEKVRELDLVFTKQPLIYQNGSKTDVQK